MDNGGLILVFVALGFAFTLLGRTLTRLGLVRLRPLNPYETLPALAADAVESDFRVHFSVGSSALGDSSTISALTAAEIIYRMSERLAVSPQSPLITFSDPLMLALAQDTLRRAYAYRQTMRFYRVTAAVWVPQGPRSLAFAAGAASIAADYDVTSNVLLGQFGYEMALLGESARRRDQGLIAHSDRLEGQAIAFAQADQVLIGEELYVGPAYVKGSALDKGGVVALDVLRWLVILGILVTALEAALR